MLVNQILPFSSFIDSTVLNESFPIAQETINRWVILKENEYPRVQKAIQEHVYQEKAEASVRKFIFLQQTELTHLADRLFGHLRSMESQVEGPTEPSPLRKVLALEGIDLAFRLLTVLQQDYSTQFHFEVHAPLAWHDWGCSTTKDLKELLPSVEKERPEEVELFVILMEYLNSFQVSEPPFQRKTWQDFGYLDLFARTVSQVLREGHEHPDAIFQPLVSQLVCLNFNYPRFYSHCVQLVTARMEVCVSFRERRRELLYHLKICRQLPEKPGCGFDLQATSLKEGMALFIEEELKYYEQVEKLHAEPFLNGKEREPYPFYFQVSFTASQLAFFVRLLVETGIIITKRKADLHAFIANHIGTVKKESLSEHSLKNKSYSPSSPVARKVKAQLHLMLQLLNEKYL